MGDETLAQIKQVGSTVDPWDLDRFQKVAKALFLLGVHFPFWRDWRFADSSIFLVLEILHFIHKFFFNHVLQWCKEIALLWWCLAHQTDDGEGTSDDCLHVIDFMYQSQSPIQTDSSIAQMESSLKDDFLVPKLELLLSFASAVQNNGGLIQYTADVSEWLLITHCKNTFRQTNKNKDFTMQVVCILDREESMQSFDMYTLMCSNNISLLNIIKTEAEDVSANNPVLDWVSCVLPEEQQKIQGPHPCRNYFAGVLLSNNAETALHVTRRPDQTNLTINAIAAMYHLVDFPEEYSRFLGLYGADVELTWRIFDCITIWHKFQVQLHSVFCPSMIMPSQVVQAKPPSDDFPLGCGDVVVVKAGDDSTSYIAQVRMVFQPCPPPCSRVQIPSYLTQPLLYVQPFHVALTPNEQPELDGQVTHEGRVIPLAFVSHAIELVPIFGPSPVPPTVTAAMSQEVYDQFFLNHYGDKETYNMIHGMEFF
ncbi:hypothetical protein SCLCIDRAFT_26833 [Scleroderma citrinum Foug A]|uniref:DUF6830 domain-containing protein n=1 Tax=Scleroderma citrinum Foug A TaxID=1036808 RepID=A0A0C3A643_9AGAM|nr:hypothetical protein SCLCIDRAFT_26833 [Scleroderma citrinum Foug A]